MVVSHTRRYFPLLHSIAQFPVPGGQVSAVGFRSQLLQQGSQLARVEGVVGAVGHSENGGRPPQTPRRQTVLEPVQRDLADLQEEHTRQRAVRAVECPVGDTGVGYVQRGVDLGGGGVRVKTRRFRPIIRQ